MCKYTWHQIKLSPSYLEYKHRFVLVRVICFNFMSSKRISGHALDCCVIYTHPEDKIGDI